jgi:hypothetical protein
MPNWVRNIVRFSDNEEVIERMMNEIRGEREDQFIDFNKIAPLPKEFINDWYDWQINNWGTKWNASDTIDLGDGVEFNTAWATPFELLLKLSEKYPEVTINVRYADEDFGYNVGEYTLLNGEKIDSNIPKGGTREAYLMAIEVQYGDVSDYFDCNEEMFTELWGSDEDDLGDYLKQMVDIAYEFECYPTEGCEYHKLVLERFKDKALADEKFDLVAIIQKEIDKIIEE